MVEYLYQLVVWAGLGQQLRGRSKSFAGACGGAEAGVGVGLEQRGDDLPQRFGDAAGGVRRAVDGEVLDEGVLEVRRSGIPIEKKAVNNMNDKICNNNLTVKACQTI